MNKYTLILIGVLFALSIGLNIYGLTRSEDNPLQSTSITVESQVPGVDPPQVYARKAVTINVTSCVTEKVDENVNITFIRTDIDEGILGIPTLNNIGVTRQPGCTVNQVKLGLPSTAEKGTWVIQVKESVKGNELTSNSNVFKILEVAE